jgi:predicted nucleic acid-binding protein
VSRYVDASAVVKLYVEEPDSPMASEVLDSPWASGRHTFVEVRRALAQTLEGRELDRARARFEVDWNATVVCELDASACFRAAELAETTGARTLDALHLAAAERAGADDGLTIVTFDKRMAVAARSLGWRVLPE